MKKNAPHILFDISGHGFGHAAMTTPIINALQQARPDIRITLRSLAPRHFFDQTLDAPYELIEHGNDFGMVMHDAFRINTEASLAKYQSLYEQWPQRLTLETEKLQHLKPDLLISNISYLSIAAAAQAQIPCIAYSCLNWAEIFQHYFATDAAAQPIYQHMLETYRQAQLILRPAPAMPMHGLDSQLIGPVATLGHDHRQQLKQRLGLTDQTHFIIASLGGVSTELSCRNWPRLQDWHYLVPDDIRHHELRDDASSIDAMGMDFRDALASASLYLTKPGYGAFSTAACQGIPVIYTDRGEWPEQPYLVQWLEQQQACEKISRHQLEQGDFSEPLQRLIAAEPHPPIRPSGIEQMLTEILKCLN